MMKLEDISFSYSEKPFIQALNLEFKEGEIITVLGPNGSGKSTVIKILTGELKPRDGHVWFDGQDIHRMPVRQLAQKLSVMTQNASVNFPYTCLEVVQMGLYPHKELGVGFDREEVESLFELMRRTETDGYAQKLITEVSGGEAQRVLFTRILAQNTPVIVLDEAFSAMDIAHRVDMLKLMKQQVNTQKKTVVAVMHDLNMAYLFSDRVILVKEGHVVAQGYTDEVMTSENLHETFGIHVNKIEKKGFLIEHI